MTIIIFFGVYRGAPCSDDATPAVPWGATLHPEAPWRYGGVHTRAHKTLYKAPILLRIILSVHPPLNSAFNSFKRSKHFEQFDKALEATPGGFLDTFRCAGPLH